MIRFKCALQDRRIKFRNIYENERLNQTDFNNSIETASNWRRQV